MKKDVMHINEIINSKEGKNLKRGIKNHSGKIVGNSLRMNNKNDTKKKNIESISIDLAGENSSSYHSSKNNNVSLFMQKSPSLKMQHDKIGSNHTNTSNTPIEKSPISIIKRAKSGIKEKEYVSKYKNINIISDEDYQKLSNEHEQLIHMILEEEKDFRTIHKDHIDEMANLIKEEISNEREIDKPQRDLESYINVLSRIFKKEICKITKLNKRLGSFKNMLKDQEILASKFGEQSEMVSRYISNNTQIVNTELEDLDKSI